VLAETVSFTEEEILVIRLVLLGILAAHVVVAGLGCFWAWRAGRGSQPSTVAWLVVLAIESMYLAMALPSLLRGEPNFYLGGAAVPLAAQVLLFLGARKRTRTGP
jgi:hypothetical protein